MARVFFIIGGNRHPLHRLSHIYTFFVRCFSSVDRINNDICRYESCYNASTTNTFHPFQTYSIPFRGVGEEPTIHGKRRIYGPYKTPISTGYEADIQFVRLQYIVRHSTPFFTCILFRLSVLLGGIVLARCNLHNKR